MPKKTVSKKVTAKAKAPPPKVHGMWKILEFKQRRLKEMESARQTGHEARAAHAIEPQGRDTRFVKFAGPRRKVG